MTDVKSLIQFPCNALFADDLGHSTRSCHLPPGRFTSDFGAEEFFFGQKELVMTHNLIHN